MILLPYKKNKKKNKSDKSNDNEDGLTQKPSLIGVFCKLIALFLFIYLFIYNVFKTISDIFGTIGASGKHGYYFDRSNAAFLYLKANY